MERLGKYRLLESLGQAGCGRMVKARTGLRAYPVAILILAPEFLREPEQKSRIEQKCRAVSSLSHPNLGAVYEFGQDGEVFYVVLELLPARTLTSVLAEKPALSVEQKLIILIQAAAALDAAHAHGVAHQNLEPGNIHIAGAGTVKIGGFIGGSVSDPGAACGKGPANRYLSPEQTEGGTGTGNSDIYSLGLIAYEFLTGMHPFPETHSAPMGESAPPIQIPTVERFPDLPLGLWPILEKALARTPGDRFPSASDFAAACQKLLDELAEDAHLMRIELQTELSRLRRAASRPDAPPDMARLRTDVEQALLAGDQTSYQQLNRLVVALAGHYPYLHSCSAAGTPASPAERDGEPQQEDNPVFPGTDVIGSPVRQETPSSDAVQPLPAAPKAQNQLLSSPVLPSLEPDQSLPEQQECNNSGPVASASDGMGRGMESVPPQETQPEAPAGKFQWEEEDPGHDGYPDIPAEPPRGTSIQKPMLWQANWWVAIAAGVVVVALISLFWLHSRSGSVSAGDFTATAASQTVSGPGGDLPEGLARTDPSWSAVRRNILMEEATTLHTAGRQEESRVFLIRLLEVNPAYQPARDELKQIEEEIQALLDQDQRDLAVQQLLASAATAIKTGRMPKAKSDLDKADSLQPGLAETEVLRKRWRARNEELAQAAAREKTRQQEAERVRQSEELRLRAEDLYRHGQYDELQAVIEKDAPDGPVSAQIQDLLARTGQLQENLNAFRGALNAGKSAEALRALENMERINPSDPNLPSLRRRLEKPKSPGTARLSLRPLGEAAHLTIDDKPVGAGGEVVDLSIPAGSHKIAAQNARGLQVVQSHEFSDGEQVSLVYDVAAQLLRPMTDADTLTVARMKARQQTHRFPVEHPHGLFRGSCKGELIVGYYEVVYRPSDGSHGFTVPFKTLVLKVEDRTAVLVFASGGKELAAFKLPDPAAAEALKNIWDEIASLGQ